MYTDVDNGQKNKMEWFGEMGENNLDKLMVSSNIKDEKYVNQESLAELMKLCNWVGTGYEFLYAVAKSRSEKFSCVGKSSVVLGLSSFYEVPQAMSVHIEGNIWDPHYEKYGIDPDPRRNPEHTKQFMEALLNDKEVESVVFFVPPELYRFKEMSGYGSETTRNEFDFLLQNPSMSGKVFLVFGAYDMVNQEVFNKDHSIFRGDLINEEQKTEAQLKLAIEFERFVNNISIDKED